VTFLSTGGFPMRGHEQLTPEMGPAEFAPQLSLAERTWPAPTLSSPTPLRRTLLT
jgi:hypothetical protein